MNCKALLWTFALATIFGVIRLIWQKGELYALESGGLLDRKYPVLAYHLQKEQIHIPSHGSNHISNARPKYDNSKQGQLHHMATPIQGNPIGRWRTKEIYKLENSFLDQEHPALLKRIREHWIHTPSKGPSHISYKKPDGDYSEEGQSHLVDTLLQGRKHGFFVECGAYDGERSSNSLFFELKRNWTGLLIEPDPKSYSKILKKNRNAFSINACLNTRNVSEMQVFRAKDQLGRLDQKHLITIPESSEVKVQCFTLFSIMKALGQNKIDFFSLDVEGAELDVLKTIPFSKLFIDVILIEYVAFPVKRRTYSAQQIKDKIKPFMKAQGYELIKDTMLDLLYRKRDTLS